MNTDKFQSAVEAAALAVDRQCITTARAAVASAADGLSLDKPDELAALDELVAADDLFRQTETLAARAHAATRRAQMWILDPATMHAIFAPVPKARPEAGAVPPDSTEADAADFWKNPS